MLPRTKYARYVRHVAILVPFRFIAKVRLFATRTSGGLPLMSIFVCRCNGVVVVSACMAAAVWLAALADGWAVESSGESDDGLEAQAAARPRKRGGPPGRTKTFSPAVTAIVPVQNSVLKPASLELRDVLAAVSHFTGLDIVA